MGKQELLDLLKPAPEYHSVLNQVQAGPGEQLMYGLTGSMKSFVTAALCRHSGRPCLVVVSTPQAAERTREDLQSLVDDREVALFPAMELLPYDILAHSPEVVAQRLQVLERLAEGKPPVVIAPVNALLRALVPLERFRENCRWVRWGDRVELHELLADLVRLGYERVELVEGRGQFSLRGGVLDIFALSAEAPWRVEFFDDEVDSIREFDPGTQRSTHQMKGILIPPAREFVLPPDDRAAACRAIRKELETTKARLERSDHLQAATRLQERVEAQLERIEQGIYFEGLEQYAPYFHTNLATFFDYFPPNLLVVLDEPTRLKEAAEEAEKFYRERQLAWIDQGGLLPAQSRLQAGWGDIYYAATRRSVVSYALLLKQLAGSDPKHIVSVLAKQMQSFYGRWPLFVDELSRLREGRYRILVMAGTAERMARLQESLREADIPPTNVAGLEAGRVAVEIGSLETGFQWPGLRLAVVTDAEIFGRPKAKRRVPTRTVGRDAVRVASYRDLNVGDHVVHVNHGIGRYLGVKTLEVERVSKDYLFIKYDGADRLYVPTDQIHLIQKYVGPEGHEPRLYKLGSGEWQKVKTRVKESIQKLAIELLRLQAIRQSRPGFGFDPDTVWQREFEDAFKYEETPDQLQATEEIKRDMEQSRAMDRLLCGDVGYGKTEVALRAIFKAVDNSKQVAVLVPTTILAQQHYNTFRERFAGYPVRIALLSRFRSPGEQDSTVRAVAGGEVDVVIGTHRLLSDDVRFRNLGLLVVDEEQRFGVGHKEKIKMLSQSVDVVTLTATPIPRTLHMSLVGLRDMSTIETPPEDRYPVETYVAEYSEALVRDAINREVHRGGQVYYLHNRVATIERAAAKLQALMPEVRIGVAHGQLREDQLEEVMVGFLDGEYDVLVCTTIIENGLDIPNVNTLVVEDADHLGLAQLYQLRGRVGRSNRLAYAYFLYRRDKVLTEVAEKRLAAIREFTEFGSGYKIALRDLEIRGAGNILGPEQHGFIVSVGFDLYVQLLEEAVKELKGEVKQPEPEPSLELGVDAYISDAYISDPKLKIEAYQKIMAIRAPRDAYDVQEELEDRYGDLPRPVQNLLSIARLKALCREMEVASINQQRDRITIKFNPGVRLSPERVSPLQRRFRGRLTPGSGKTSTLTLRLHQPSTDEVLGSLDEVLPLLRELVTVAEA